MKITARLIAMTFCCAAVGCAAINDARQRNDATANSMLPASEDGTDEHQNENRVDRELEDTMRHARKDLSTSKERSGWFDNMRDPQALRIERNLGVEHY